VFVKNFKPPKVNTVGVNTRTKYTKKAINIIKSIFFLKKLFILPFFVLGIAFSPFILILNFSSFILIIPFFFLKYRINNRHDRNKRPNKPPNEIRYKRNIF